MNKLKFIPVLAIAALLSGCGTTNSANVKAPKFAKEGEEYEVEAWFDEVWSGFYNLDFEDTKFMGSKEGTFRGVSQQTSNLNREGKLISKYLTQDSTSVKVVSDFQSKVISAQFVYETKQSMEYKGVESQSSTGSEEQNYYFQKAEYDHTDYYVRADVDKKVAERYSSVTDDRELADIHDYFSKGFLGYETGLYNLAQILYEVDNIDEDTFALYKFFKNDNVYTMKFEFESEVKEVKVNQESDEISFKESGKRSETFQVTFNNGNIKFAYFDEITEKTEYLVDLYGYFAGDVVEEKNVRLYEIEHKDANPNLKAVDLKGYIWND